MSKKAACRLGKKRTAARLRLIRRKAAAWQRGARKALTLALIAGCLAEAPSQLAYAQMGGMGQGAMAPSGGVVNRAVGRLQDLNQNGPGWMYYGINAADRGLGYNGSYMTLGGFIPYAEDDLGGFWAADLRGHFSEYGGFFSNVGFVRKQFLGGSLFGVGVYWDYDGDQNQYSTAGMCGTGPFGQFGHSYNQVGISTEWLTDFGNLRSNGYIPVGTTAYTAGNPGSNFYQNFVMCQYGLDAALTGADLEVGAYVPGLSDWAGMISVGGYALGNARYDWSAGSLAGKDVVPWFGGVYTRLDMTLIENWDFSLQYNNDSFFDSTGFARLTYRMGGSRRRNVPDQMEQPMMRNEHIVRAHQTPEVAINPSTGTPWNVIHVNNAAAAGGTGTAEAPVNTLVQGSAAATNPWDIVFVHQGLSRTTTPYGGEFAFQAQNQYLVGDGGTFTLPSVCCGPISLSTGAGLLPLLSNPGGTSVSIDGNIAGGATVADLDILGSQIGIQASGNLTGLPSAAYTAGQPTLVQNVTISGNGTAASQRGVSIDDATGNINFRDVAIENMTNVGFAVTKGSADISYQGSITSDVAKNGGVATPIIQIKETTGGTISLASGAAPAGSTVPNAISDIGGEGIRISDNAAATTIAIDNVSLTNNVGAAIGVIGDSAITSITSGAGSGISKTTPGAAITVEGGAPVFNYLGPIANNPAAASPASFLVNVSQVSGGDVQIEPLPGSPFRDTGDGIQIVENVNAQISIGPSHITSRGAQGVLINNNSSTIILTGIKVDGASTAGVLATNSPLSSLEFRNLNISLASPGAIGFQAAKFGAISSTFANAITTASTTQPAVQITDSGPLDMTFNTISSGVTAGTNGAMEFLGTTGGNFSVTSAFLVNGTQGTEAADVNNTAGVTLTLPP